MSKEAKKYFAENIERLGGTYAVMQAYAEAYHRAKMKEMKDYLESDRL